MEILFDRGQGGILHIESQVGWLRFHSEGTSIYDLSPLFIM